MHKKHLFLFFFFFSIPVATALVITGDCSVRNPNCNPGELPILSLSANRNAMAALDPNYYPNKLCCIGDALGTDCEAPLHAVAANLSKQTNAHAAGFGYTTTYPYGVCLSSDIWMNCAVEPGPCTQSRKCVMELNSFSNSHVAACGTGYPLKVCCQGMAICGNNITEPGEECDGPDWGKIKNCTSFDEFQNNAGILDCNNQTEFEPCFFNTSLCIKDNLPENCGNGIIELNETCDFKTIPPDTENASRQVWGPTIDGCWWFDNFSAGNLSCIPPQVSHEYECHFNTSQCMHGKFPVPMNCGRVWYDSVNIQDLNTMACNDTLWKNPTRTADCANPHSCVYFNETDSTNPMPRCFNSSQTFHNIGKNNITCIGQDDLGNPINMWCPEHFHWNTTESRCVYTDPTCDSGNMTNPYTDCVANCSLPLRQWIDNISLNEHCLDPDPFDIYPKTDSCCKNFTVANYNDTQNVYRPYGFYTARIVKVY